MGCIKYDVTEGLGVKCTARHWFTCYCAAISGRIPPARAENRLHPSLKATSFHVGNITKMVALGLVCLPEASLARDNVGESGGAAGTVR